jgi:6-phosphofructokinase 1
MAPRRIGIATGGGDCPGLNAVLRAAAVRCHTLGIELLGIESGFDGLLGVGDARVLPLTVEATADLLDRGGTALGTTSRGNPLRWRDGAGAFVDRGDEVVASARTRGIEVVISVGGDGTQRISAELHRRGLPMVGVPKTIDNDLACTFESLGFPTAVQIVTDALDRLRTTAEAHHRVIIVEVMGRDAGWIALEAGIAGGADAIIVPEVPHDGAALAAAVAARLARPRPHAIVVVAEGARRPVRDASASPGAAVAVARGLAAALPHAELRVTTLGHLQRGGTPTAADRLLASRCGVEAVDLAARGEVGVLLTWQPPDIVAVPLEPDAIVTRGVDPDSQLVRHARELGISFGDTGP